MGMATAFAKFAWVPYFVLCMGLLMLFGTEEWMLLYKYNSEGSDMEATYYPKRLFRRDVDETNPAQMFYSEEMGKMYYSDVLTEMLNQIKNENQDLLQQVTELTAAQATEQVTEDITVATTPIPNKLLLNAAPLTADEDSPFYAWEVNKQAFQSNPSQAKPVVMEAPKKPVETESELTFSSVASVHTATPDELRPLMKPLGTAPVNRRFVFHNKIPKAGSTTMKWLLVALSKRNGFTLDHARWCLNEGQCNEHDPVTGQHLDGPDGEQAMVDYVPKKLEEAGDGNLLLLKHHHYFNFTQFGMEEPTYINVARDPVTRYASWYYFERYGWARQEGTRSRFFGGEEDKVRTLDECVSENRKECLEPVQVLVKYFCGTDMKSCGMMATSGHDWTKVAEATERAKRIITQNFYVVGVLEHFATTLALFEKMLPEYYDGAVEASQTPEQQRQRASTKSSNPGFTNETRHALETGVLRYEVDIYNLIKSLFFEKLKYYNIPQPLNT